MFHTKTNFTYTLAAEWLDPTKTQDPGEIKIKFTFTLKSEHCFKHNKCTII